MQRRTYLALLDLVPALGEVLNNVEYDRSYKGHMHIVPRHARAFRNVNSAADIVVHVLEVDDASVVVILPGEECPGKVSRMRVSERMVISIPATKTDVKAADASAVIINDDNFLVVGPEFDVVCGNGDVNGTPLGRK